VVSWKDPDWEVQSKARAGAGLGDSKPDWCDTVDRRKWPVENAGRKWREVTFFALLMLARSSRAKRPAAHRLGAATSPLRPQPVVAYSAAAGTGISRHRPFSCGNGMLYAPVRFVRQL
jgi:hypothetical protein